MFTISRIWTFNGGTHFLPNVPENHKCHGLHGHNYKVQIRLDANDDELDASGFVRDFGELTDFRECCAAMIDHHCLNNSIPNPTAENLAQHLFLFAMVHLGYPVQAVRVWETDDCWAEYRSGDRPDSVRDDEDEISASIYTEEELQRKMMADHELLREHGIPLHGLPFVSRNPMTADECAKLAAELASVDRNDVQPVFIDETQMMPDGSVWLRQQSEDEEPDNGLYSFKGRPRS